ncbi:hypothetical protein N0V85_000310, partial [Neurospora sp. IMI 360204]
MKTTTSFFAYLLAASASSVFAAAIPLSTAAPAPVQQVHQVAGQQAKAALDKASAYAPPQPSVAVPLSTGVPAGQQAKAALDKASAYAPPQPSVAVPLSTG